MMEEMVWFEKSDNLATARQILQMQFHSRGQLLRLSCFGQNYI